MDRLSHKLKLHAKLEFPDFPKNDDFADWVAELAETDGYYVGLAQSELANCKGINIEFSHMTNLKHTLCQFSSIEEDKEIYFQCQTYLRSMEEFVEQMRLSCQ